MVILEAFIGLVLLILLVFFIVMRIREKKEETFEKRKW